MAVEKKIVCVACSIFKKELASLQNDIMQEVECVYHSSMLHMHPELLDVQLQKDHEKWTSENARMLILYGDCSPSMHSIEQSAGVERTKGINCIELLLGEKLYRELRREGAFFMMPEWTYRWKEVFKHELGLEGELAREFMMDFHSRIIYLDTGQLEIPQHHIEEIENYTGLKVEIIKTNLTELAKNVEAALKALLTDSETNATSIQ